MKLQIGTAGRPVTVDTATLLGRGGEKIVHRDPDHPRSRAIAVYHKPDARRAAKVRAFLDGDYKLPSTVAAPQEIALNSQGRFVGFGMPQLSRRYRNLKELFVPSFCKQHGITTKVIADLFLAIGSQLTQIHSTGLLIGDLNDGAIMFHENDFDVGWVDADSWSLPSFPCIVGTQLYLCPDLYGKDLSSGDYFEPWMDWYSYAVLLTRGLLRKHPFKAGTHKQYRNVIERAKNNSTLFDADVVYPSVGFQAELLSDELIEVLQKVLKRRDQKLFPLEALKEYAARLVPCTGCGTWYPDLRSHCPVCAERTQVQARPLAGMTVETLLEVQGRILYVLLSGKTLSALSEEQGRIVFHRLNQGTSPQRIELGIQNQAGMQYGIFADSVVLCTDDEDDEFGTLYVFDVSGSTSVPITQSTTEVLAGKSPVFATSRRFLYRLANGMLVREERFGASDLLSRPVATVFPGQCWFTVDPNPAPGRETVLGLNRDVDNERWFVAQSQDGGMSYLHFDAAIPALIPGESLRDVSVRFHQDSILVLRKTMINGTERVRIAQINAASGALLSNRSFDVLGHPEWDSVHGKALRGQTLMHPTDSGLLAESILDGTTRAIAGSQSTVRGDHALLPYGSDLLVVRHSKIDRLARS